MINVILTQLKNKREVMELVTVTKLNDDKVVAKAFEEFTTMEQEGAKQWLVAVLNKGKLMLEYARYKGLKYAEIAPIFGFKSASRVSDYIGAYCKLTGIETKNLPATLPSTVEDDKVDMEGVKSLNGLLTKIGKVKAKKKSEPVLEQTHPIEHLADVLRELGVGKAQIAREAEKLGVAKELSGMLDSFHHVEDVMDAEVVSEYEELNDRIVKLEAEREAIEREGYLFVKHIKDTLYKNKVTIWVGSDMEQTQFGKELIENCKQVELKGFQEELAEDLGLDVEIKAMCRMNDKKMIPSPKKLNEADNVAKQKAKEALADKSYENAKQKELLELIAEYGYLKGKDRRTTNSKNAKKVLEMVEGKLKSGTNKV